MSSAKLTLKNMVFYGYHGVFAAEKELGQRIEADVEIVSDFENAGTNDDLELTINYVDVYTIVKEVVEENEYNLIEAIAVEVLDRVMDSFNVEKVTVRIRKPHPPLGGLLDAVEFEITRGRKKLENFRNQ